MMRGRAPVVNDLSVEERGFLDVVTQLNLLRLNR